MTRVLVVDDEEMEREVLSESVTQLGYQVEVAADGAEALASFRDGHHDVVITDLSMPRMDGIELTRRLHMLDPMVPVVMLTGRSSLDLKALAWNRGVVDYLNKPYRLSSLEDALHRIVRSRGLQRPEEAGEAAVARRLGDAFPYILAGSALLTLLLLWMFWAHLLDVRALSQLVGGPD